MKKNNHLLITDSFSQFAKPLRQHFDSQFSDPKETRSDRFVWDYWHVPNQYTLVRTPAYHYFPQKTYMAFHKELVHWGRKTLGCWDISPPWLSYYVDGCKQELHSDVPHGPWAYVFSLTTSKKFSGGETMILKPEVLNYWKNFGKAETREQESFLDRVPAKFNRLVVFDPRFPHGVTEVRGTHDPREARLVVHGWFMEPKTYIEGPLPPAKTEKILNQGFDRLMDELGQYPLVQGTVSIQMIVQSTGKVSSTQFGTNTLVTTDGAVPRSLNRRLLEIYESLEFPVAKSKTEMTIPLVFQ